MCLPKSWYVHCKSTPRHYPEDQYRQNRLYQAIDILTDLCYHLQKNMPNNEKRFEVSVHIWALKGYIQLHVLFLLFVTASTAATTSQS
jgi:hypothetical protein